MEASTTAAPRIGREGSRWFNQRPSADEFIKWCQDSVPVHEGMEIARYIPGITLISQGEKERVILGWEGPKPVKDEVWHEVYIPYPKVETRVLYWNDWIRGQEGVLGVIEPIAPEEPDPRLPVGFFSLTAAGSDYICCTMRATVYKAGTVHKERITIDKRTGKQAMATVGEVVFQGTPATKQVLAKEKDENILMKAETGAIGRALGLAGMLVVPGAGIASAEDIQEHAGSAGGAESPQPTLPIEVADSRPASEQIADLRKRANTLIRELATGDETKKAAFQSWVDQRGFEVADADFGTLKAAVKKLEQLLA